jgi:hypothetical protein
MGKYSEWRSQRPTRAEQGRGADGFQRPLLRRARFQPQLTPSVSSLRDPLARSLTVQVPWGQGVSCG